MDRLAYDTMVTTTVAVADNNIDADVVVFVDQDAR